MLESKTSSGDPVPAPQDPISVSLDILSSLPRTPLTAGPLTLDLPLLLSRHKRAYTQSSDHLLSPAPLGCAGAVQALKNYAVDGGYPGDNEEGLDQYMTDSMDEARKLWVEKGYGEAAGEGDVSFCSLLERINGRDRRLIYG